VVGRPIMQAHTQTDAHTDRHRQTHTQTDTDRHTHSQRERETDATEEARTTGWMNTAQNIICSRATSCLHGEDDEREVLIVCSKHGN
jgi:hypothetical protein